MSKAPYSFGKETTTRYRFISRGKAGIEKVVEFTPLNVNGYYNLGFGDVTESGTVSDRSVSNNGDIIKVLATVIHIIRDFTLDHPEARILFTGSTVLRTAVYQRILKSYYSKFSKDFRITAIVETDNRAEEVFFDPSYSGRYKAFIIQRKH